MTEKQKLPLKRVFSAGGVVVKRGEDGSPLFLLGKHSGYHKWVLPKGIIEKEESPVKTALREVREETGVESEPITEKPVHKENYFYVSDYENREKARVSKTVTFFVFRFKKGSPNNHGPEMEKAGWFGKEEALERMAFSGEKEALEKGFDFVNRRQRSRRKLF